MAPKPITRGDVAAALGPIVGPRMSQKRVAVAAQALCDLHPELTDSAARSVCHHMAAAHKADPKLSFEGILKNLGKQMPALAEPTKGAGRYYAGSSGMPQVVGGSKPRSTQPRSTQPRRATPRLSPSYKSLSACDVLTR